MTEEMKKLIEEYKEEGIFTYVNVTDDMIAAEEKKLNLSIPRELVEYLKLYGHGGIGGIEVWGFGKTGVCIFTERTFEYRKHGMPTNLIAIENCDEWIYSIDSSNGKIMSWSIDGLIKEEYKSFDEYMKDRLNDVIENL